MAEVFGDADRKYGIPGIDNQVPGSPAQDAGVAAYKSTYEASHDRDQAAQAAVNAAASSILTNPKNNTASGMTSAQALTAAEAKAGTIQPTMAGASPSLIQAAWLEGLLGNRTAVAPRPQTSSSQLAVASDGQTLDGQGSAIKSSYEAQYGAAAAAVWAAEHNAGIGQGGGAGTSVTIPISMPGGTSPQQKETAAGMGAGVGGLSTWATQNPVPAVLAALGLLWILGGKRR